MMLKIKRVPTLLSNYQQDDDEEGSGCGRNCLGNCCIRGMKLPLYTFKAIDKMIHEKDVWEDRMQRGLFRYDHRVFQFLLHGDMGSTQIPSANICAGVFSPPKRPLSYEEKGSRSSPTEWHQASRPK
ncbi:hypothetical protein NE237_029212 [Protea cynaroides]|uniref:Uncharacterized protein n=1 Tax=Protea cynaroides TaxID=273540 RepID=A0A9Q0GRV3_9MAGN|nr:hypothetical protein NE237_029212 [Protea cynaroides]